MIKVRNFITTALIGSVVLIPLLLPSSSEAVPAFGRKYKIECTVCHTRPPRLNPFGEHFLENGYQIPGTQDGGITEKVKLGNVTLGDVSNFFAVRFRGNFLSRFKQSKAEDRSELAFPEVINVFFAGTLTKNVGTFAEMEGNLKEGEIAFERGFLTVNNLLSNFIGPDAAHLRLGKLDPSAFFSYPTHRQQLNPVSGKIEEADDFEAPAIKRIPLVPYAMASKFFGLFNGEGKAIVPLQPSLYNTTANIGIELHGRPFGDWFLYEVGILNGAGEEFGDSNNKKDVYIMGRLDWARSKLFSANLSAFGYFGNDTAKVKTEEFVDWHRIGIGANVRWRMIDLYGAFIWDKIRNLPRGIAPAFDDTASGFTMEADVIATNRLLFSLRYDWLDPGGISELQKKTGSFLGLQAKYYLRDNIAFLLRSDINLRGGGGRPLRNLRNGLFAGVDFAF